MLWEWFDNFWVLLVFAGFVVAFFSVVTSKLDKAFTGLAKAFDVSGEGNANSGSGIFYILLQTTPMIASFLALTVILVGFIIYHSV